MKSTLSGVQVLGEVTGQSSRFEVRLHDIRSQGGTPQLHFHPREVAPNGLGIGLPSSETLGALEDHLVGRVENSR